MKLWEGLWHDFFYFFVDQFTFLISKHFFKLNVTVCYCSKGYFARFNTYEGQILILAHFNQIPRIPLKFLGLFYVFLGLLISFLCLCQVAHIYTDIHEKLNIRTNGQFVVWENFIDFVVIFINQFLMMFVFFSKVPDFIDGWTCFTNLLPKFKVIKGTHGDLFIKSHKVLVKIIIHHEDVIVLLFCCVELFFIISLMPSKSVHH